MDDLKPTIIIDNGSQNCKVGISGDDSPRCCFEAMVGRPKNRGIMSGMDWRDYYVGMEAQQKRGILNLKYPIQNCNVDSWDDMEKIWHHAFYNELRVAPEDHRIVITDKLNNKMHAREKMASIMFESFQVPSLYICNSLGSILCATGRESGVVVDSGHQMTDVACILDQIYVSNTYNFSAIGGEQCTQYLMKNLYYNFSTTAEREIVRHIKETLSYVTLDYQSELINQVQQIKNYELPDGNEVSLGKERFQCTEILFNPNLFENESLGLHKLIQSSLNEIKDIEFKRLFMKDIIFSGGNSLIPNIQERLQKEINDVYNPKVYYQIVNVDKHERQNQTWKGAMIQSSVISESQMIQKSDYKECGASIVQRRYKGMNQYYH